MKQGVRIDVIVPAHNEAAHIGQVLDSMPAYVDRIWVVDDGSTDDTVARVMANRHPRVAVRRHRRCLGVGAALRNGYKAAFADGADIVAVMAGDGQMAPEDLPALLAPLLHGEADYSKGNRLGPSAWRHMPKSRLFGNYLLSALTRLATGLSVDDSQCGYTALSRQAASRLPWARLWHGYGYPNDLLGWAAIVQLRVVDVPVRAIYGDEVSGVRLRHAIAVVPFLLARVILRRLRYRGSLPHTADSVA